MWQNPGMYEVTVQAQDVHGLTSPWSDKLTVTIELDIDGDGLSDERERIIGSDCSDPSDVHILIIDGTTCCIVTFQGSEDVLFYNMKSQTSCSIETSDEHNYLFDFDCDGAWDYTYCSATGILTPYAPPSDEHASIDLFWLWSILGIIGGILLILFLLYKAGFLYIYEEYIIEE